MKTLKNKPKSSRSSVFIKLNKSVDKKAKHRKVAAMGNEVPNDRLEMLKLKYQQEIRAKKNELATLEAKLRCLDEFTKDAEKLREPEPALDKYAGDGLTYALYDAAVYLWRAGKGTANGATAGQVRDFILAHGFPLSPDARAFGVSIHVTLARLVEAGKLKVTNESGMNFYKPVQSSFGHIGSKMSRGRSMRVKRTKRHRILAGEAGKTGSGSRQPDSTSSGLATPAS